MGHGAVSTSNHYQSPSGDSGYSNGSTSSAENDYDYVKHGPNEAQLAYDESGYLVPNEDLGKETLIDDEDIETSVDNGSKVGFDVGGGVSNASTGEGIYDVPRMLKPSIAPILTVQEKMSLDFMRLGIMPPKVRENLGCGAF